MRTDLDSSHVLNILLYVAYTLMSVAGLILVKYYMPALKQAVQEASFMRKEVFFVGVGAALYIVSFLVWMTILGRIELSVAYPIAIGLTLIFSTIAAAVLIGEQVSLVRSAGIAVVFGGILMITCS